MKRDINNILRDGGPDAVRTALDAAAVRSALKRNTSDKPKPKKDGPKKAAAIPPTSEQGLAIAFADRHAVDFRYVPDWSKWMRWTGTHWQKDTLFSAWRSARQVIFDAIHESDDGAQINRLTKAATEAAVVALAQKDARIVADVDLWDQARWLLNTPSATIDLKSMTARDHRPEDFITKITSVSVDASLPIPLWMKFLSIVMDGDEEMVAFLQRVLGYCLTGSTREQVLFFLYGKGKNGKGVFISTVTGILGKDYSTSATTDAFTSSGHVDRNNHELAGLRGARLVTAVETEQGKAWAEARLKSITGSDRVTARDLYQSFFSFDPEFKLMISGNHKPAIRSPDVAMRRRMMLIPFTVTIPEELRDPDLAEELVAERPGILAWMVKGRVDYLERGLAPPAKVTAATADYLDEEDAVARWLADKCDRDPQSRTRSGTLYASWRSWADGNGETVGTSKELTQKLVDRGFQHKRSDGSWIVGIRLIPDETPRQF